MSYLFHFLIALVVSIAYFSLQADFSVELKKQKTLFILTICVFIATFSVAYICIKPKTSVSWGRNQIEEFEDDVESYDGDFKQNQLPNQGGYVPTQSIPVPTLPQQSELSAPTPRFDPPTSQSTVPSLPTF